MVINLGGRNYLVLRVITIEDLHTSVHFRNHL
jgi:hypothetical protein